MIAKAFEFPKELTEFIKAIENSANKITEKPDLRVSTHQTITGNEKDISSVIDNVMIALLELKKTFNGQV